MLSWVVTLSRVFALRNSVSMRLAIPRRLAAYYFIDSLITSIPWNVYAPYLKMLGITPLEYGLLGAIRAGCGALATFIGGALADRYRAFNAIALSFALFAAGLLMISAGTIPLLYAGVTVLGLSQFSGLVLRVAISRVFREEEYEKVYSQIFSLSLAGEGVGAFTGWLPYLAPQIFHVTLFDSYRATLAICAIASIATLPLLYIPQIREARGGTQRLSFSVDRATARAVWKLVIVRSALALGAFMAIRNVDYYLVLKFNVQSNALGTLRGVEMLAIAALTTLTPRVKRVMGSSIKAYVAISSGNVPLMIFLTLAPNFPLAASIYVARTVLANIGSPLLTSFTMRYIPQEYRGRGLSLMRLALTGVGVAGRAIGGELMDMDLDLPFRVAAALYAASYAAMLAIWGREEKKLEARKAA